MMLLFPLLGLAAALIHMALDKKLRTPKKAIEIILLYQLVIGTGLGCFSGFIGHTLRDADTAKFIGWKAGSPFQFEVAMANLAFAVLGVLCYWFRGNFWLATIVSTTVFGWGAAWVHINDILNRNNMKPGNAGLVLYLDILMPVIMIGLYAAMNLAKERKAKRKKAK